MTMDTLSLNEDYACKLCKVYMHDLLDSPPCKPKDRTEYSRRLRPLLPELVETFAGFIQDIGPYLPVPKGSDEYDIIDICSELGLLEQIEVCLDMLSKKGGFRNKEFRDWLLEKFIIVVKDLHQIHRDHIMTPFLYKIRKIDCVAKVDIELEVNTLKPKTPHLNIDSPHVDSMQLRIKIPTHC